MPGAALVLELACAAAATLGDGRDADRGGDRGGNDDRAALVISLVVLATRPVFFGGGGGGGCEGGGGCGGGRSLAYWYETEECMVNMQCNPGYELQARGIAKVRTPLRQASVVVVVFAAVAVVACSSRSPATAFRMRPHSPASYTSHPRR